METPPASDRLRFRGLGRSIEAAACRTRALTRRARGKKSVRQAPGSQLLLTGVGESSLTPPGTRLKGRNTMKTKTNVRSGGIGRLSVAIIPQARSRANRGASDTAGPGTPDPGESLAPRSLTAWNTANVKAVSPVGGCPPQRRREIVSGASRNNKSLEDITMKIKTNTRAGDPGQNPKVWDAI